MADIKTRDAVRGTIKTIDKAAVASERMKSAYSKIKDKAEQGYYAEEGSATERPGISVIPYQWQAHRIIPGCIKPKYASPNRAAFHPWI